MTTGATAMERVGAGLRRFGPPIIVFNKSHSGSRLLAKLLLGHGVFLGGERNMSEDAFGILDLVRPLVERHYPTYADLWRDDDAEMACLAEKVFERHLRGIAPGARWGWKLCETLYILPVLWRLFPDARFVHLIRDGRDVAFSDHVEPAEPFWRKVYFDTDRIERWDGRELDRKAYRRVSHIYNARHWVNSVTAARHYGAVIGGNYIEVRYEDLVLQPRETAGKLLSDLGVTLDGAFMDRFVGAIDTRPVGKHERMPRRARSEAEAVLRPMLEAFGYGLRELPPYWPRFLRR